VADAEFRYSDLLPTGQDDIPYRLITTDGVSTFEANGRTFLQVDPEALHLLTAEAMHDIAHYLRPAHLQQLRKIIDGPDASGNDRFVALDLLKNVGISAGGVLPMYQDTGTAIVMGKKSEDVLTGADDAEWISKGGPGGRAASWVSSSGRANSLPPRGGRAGKARPLRVLATAWWEPVTARRQASGAAGANRPRPGRDHHSGRARRRGTGISFRKMSSSAFLAPSAPPTSTGHLAARQSATAQSCVHPRSGSGLVAGFLLRWPLRKLSVPLYPRSSSLCLASMAAIPPRVARTTEPARVLPPPGLPPPSDSPSRPGRCRWNWPACRARASGSAIWPSAPPSKPLQVDAACLRGALKLLAELGAVLGPHVRKGLARRLLVLLRRCLSGQPLMVLQRLLIGDAIGGPALPEPGRAHRGGCRPRSAGLSASQPDGWQEHYEPVDRHPGRYGLQTPRS
jgi:hypothetical protein